MIIRDEEFVEEIIRRYHALRESWLSDEYLIDYIDKTIAYLGPAIDRNFDVWGYTFAEYRPLDPDSRNPEDYDAAVEQTAVKLTMLQHARVRVLLCDSSKFGSRLLCRTCGFEQLDYLLTAQDPGPEYTRAAAEAGCEILWGAP